MLSRFREAIVLTAALAYGFVAAAATAQQDGAAKAKVESSSAGDEEFLPVEQIMTQAVRNISIRYNLNEEQTQLTDQLMRREVRKFLRDHHEQVWPVLRDFIRYQSEGKVPEGDPAKRIGGAAYPIFQLAKDAILKSNEEWRTFLNEEQRRLHDWDMKEMARTFGDIDNNISRLKEGKPIDGGLIPPPQNLQSQPPRPKRPPPGLPAPRVQGVESDVFESFVKQFIIDNELDPTQVQAARSILDEFKEKAKQYFETKKTEIAAIEAAERKGQENLDMDAISAAYATRKKVVLEPINAMIDEMEHRLVKLLTSEQLARYRLRRGETVDVAKAADAEAGAKRDGKSESAPEGSEAAKGAEKSGTDGAKRGKGKKTRGDGDAEAPRPIGSGEGNGNGGNNNGSKTSDKPADTPTGNASSNDNAAAPKQGER